MPGLVLFKILHKELIFLVVAWYCIKKLFFRLISHALLTEWLRLSLYPLFAVKNNIMNIMMFFLRWSLALVA